MRTAELDIDTTGRHVVDLTEDVVAFCEAQGDGLLSVFAPHATAGVALMETGAGSDTDLEELVARLLPRDDRYQHRHGSPGHGADHLLPVLVSPSLTIPVAGGAPSLGAWQRVVFIDFNRDNPRRRVRLSFIAG